MELITVISAIYLIYVLLKEALEKPITEERYFDWDAYWKDVDDGVFHMDIIKKRERGEYYKFKSEEDK